MSKNCPYAPLDEVLQYMPTLPFVKVVVHAVMFDEDVRAGSTMQQWPAMEQQP